MSYTKWQTVHFQSLHACAHLHQTMHGVSDIYPASKSRKHRWYVFFVTVWNVGQSNTSATGNEVPLVPHHQSDGWRHLPRHSEAASPTGGRLSGISRTSRFSAIRNNPFRMDHENKLALRLFQSHQAIEAEVKRQNTMKSSWLIIHPYSPFRWHWDLWMVILIVYTICTNPVAVAFYADGTYVAEVELATKSEPRGAMELIVRPSSKYDILSINIFDNPSYSLRRFKSQKVWS